MNEPSGGSSAAGPSTVAYAPKGGYKLVREYLMGDVLGEGSQGKVRDAVHSESLRRVAIKIINTAKLRKVRNAEANLRRELTIHRRLKHAHVVEMIDSFAVEEKQKVYVVLEHVSGGSLQDLLDGMTGGVLPAPMTRHFMRQLLDGLAYCHAQGIVHRDIKPSNLLVTIDGVLKVADFGSAEELDPYDASDACSKSKGSPAFQPPEVAAGNASFPGFAVDVWAAGVTLYLLSSGRVPFAGSSLMALFENIARGEYEMPESILADAPLAHLASQLLCCDHATRIGVDGALRHEWLHANGARLRWGEAERALVGAVPKGTKRSQAVLRAVARMYGEELLSEPEGHATVLATPFDAALGHDDDAALEAELHADSSPSATASAPGAAPAAGTGDAASASSGSVHWSGALSADAEDEP